MTVLGTVTQQPVERLDYDIDYSDWLTQGDEIDNAVAVVSPPGPVVDQIFIQSSRVKLYVSGGSDGGRHKITVTATTADGRVKQDELKINIKDA